MVPQVGFTPVAAPSFATPVYQPIAMPAPKPRFTATTNTKASVKKPSPAKKAQVHKKVTPKPVPAPRKVAK